jgi:hypothetical protein
MGLGGTVYRIIVVLHIMCAIIGFGAVYLNALYGQQIRKRQGRDGLAVYEANFFVSRVGQFFIYGVFVFGILAVLASDDAWKFDQTWIGLSMLLYLVALGVSHGVLLPAVKRMGVLMRELVDAGSMPERAGAAPPAGPPPQVVELGTLGQRVGATGAFLDVMVVVILCLMIWKPA